MRRYLRILPALVLAGLAACNGSDGSSNDEDDQAAGDSLNPTAIAAETSPPTGGQLPAELLPPS
jgi:hypothetical protein